MRKRSVIMKSAKFNPYTSNKNDDKNCSFIVLNIHIHPYKLT